MGSKSKTKLETTPQQKKAWEFYGTDVVPMARGEDTALSQQLEQQASDISALQREQSSQQIMDVAGTAGMGSSQIAGLLSESEDNAIQGAFKNVMGAKTSLAGKALDMISALPKGPGTVSEQKEGTASVVGKVAGAAKDVFGAGGVMGKPPIESPTDPTQGLETKVTDASPVGSEQVSNEAGGLLGDIVGGEEGGALSGAASGAAMGMAAGPWGALAGGVAGGAMGFFGGDDDEDEEKEELEEEIQELEETPAGKQKKRREEIKNA